MGSVFPILMIIGANTLYNLFTHDMPKDANPFAALLITYLTAGGISLGFLLFGNHSGSLLEPFRYVNWTSVGLGAAIVLLESGFIQAFRAGWNLSACSLVANISLAMILLLIGAVFYREHLSLNQFAGIGLCLLGLFFINRH